MSFTQKEIKTKRIGIVDIGSYKVRCGICEFKNGNIELIGYGEKRQNAGDIVSHSIKNIEGMCATIGTALKNAESDGKTTVSEIVINIPFEDIFFSYKGLNYKRKNPKTLIDKKELTKILSKVETINLSKASKEIQEKSIYKQKNLELIIADILKIKIDSKQTDKLLGMIGSEINISSLNVLIPIKNYNIIQYIGNSSGKKIIKIIPSEFCIPKLFGNDKELIIIDIGSSYISIIVKKQEKILGLSKIPAGINDLIKNIQENYKQTRIEIIQKIDENIYLPEKQKFLEIFETFLMMGLEEIIGNNICPNQFFITGGGNNEFIRNAIKQFHFSKYGLKLINNIEYIKPDLPGLDHLASKSNVNIISMMMSVRDILRYEHDPISKSMKEAIKKIKFS